MPSSVIAAMGYCPQTLTLTIIYRGHRGAYLYFSVPPAEWEAFRTAPSKGTYLNEVFKPKNYPYQKAAGPTPLPKDKGLVWAR